MLRELHDLTAGHPLAAGRECFLHGDAGPFNTIFSGGLPVAFIDWASCRPGDRLDDLGYMACTWCIQAQGNVPVDEHAGQQLRDGGPDTRSRAREAISWASADQELTRASWPVLWSRLAE